MNIPYTLNLSSNTHTNIRLDESTTLLQLKDTLNTRYNTDIVAKHIFVDGSLVTNDEDKISSYRKGLDTILLCDKKSVFSLSYLYLDREDSGIIEICDDLPMISIRKTIALDLNVDPNTLMMDLGFEINGTSRDYEPFSSFNVPKNSVLKLATNVPFPSHMLESQRSLTPTTSPSTAYMPATDLSPIPSFTTIDSNSSILSEEPLKTIKIDFTKEDIKDFIYKMENSVSDDASLFDKSVGYYNRNHYLFAKHLAAYNGCKVWVEYMINNTTNPSYTRQSIHILDTITEDSNDVCLALVDKDPLKSLFNLLLKQLSTKYHLKVIKTIQRIISADPATSTTLIVNNCYINDIFFKLKNNIALINELHEMARLMENAPITDHHIVFELFYADIKLSSKNVDALIDIYQTLAQKTYDIQFSTREVQSIRSAIHNNTEKYSTNMNYISAEDALDSSLHHEGCCSIY